MKQGKQVDNIIDSKQPSHVFDDPIICYREDSFNSKSQPLSNHEIEDGVRRLKHEENCELIQGGYVPLSFGSFEFLKKNAKSITGVKDGEFREGPIVSLEPIHNKLH